MKTLDKYQAEFGKPQDQWGIEEWKRIAIELASLADSRCTPKKKGRPTNNGKIDSAEQNYQALAFWVAQRIEAASREGKTLEIKDATREEMHASVNRRNSPQFGPSSPTRHGLVDTKLETAYTAVRKILAAQSKADKK